MRSYFAGCLLLLMSCSDSRAPRESAAPTTPPANRQSVDAPPATPYAITPYVFQGLNWGLYELAVRDSLQTRGFTYLGGITTDDKHTSPMSCLSSLRPKDVPDYSFQPDSVAFADCKGAAVLVGHFTGRILSSTDDVSPWFDDSRELVRVIVTTKAYSLEEAERAYTDIRATLTNRYGPAVQDSMTNGKDIVLASKWWDSAGHSMNLDLQESHYGRLAGPPEYEISVDYIGPRWEAYRETRRQRHLSTFN